MARNITHERMRISAALTASAAGMLVLAGCGGSFTQSSADSPDVAFSIGVVAPLTGVTSLEGKSMVQGFELGLNYVNDNGGVLGKDVEWEVLDDMSSAATSTQVAQRLIREDQVDYLFGTIAGDSGAAVAAVARDGNVPFSSSIMGTIPFCSAHYWPFGVTEPMLLNDLVSEMVATWGPRVAFVGNDYSFPHQYADAAREALADAGGEFVLEEYSPLGTTDWQPVISKIQSADADWVLDAVVGGDAVAFAQQAEQFGALDNRGFTGTTHQQEFFSSIGGIIEGDLTVLPYTDQLDTEENAAFVKAYREAYDFEGPIPAVAASSYAAALFIAEAVNEAGSYDPDAISAEMGKLKFTGVLGEGSFNPDSHYWSQNMLAIEVGPDGEYTIVKDLGAVADERPRDCG